MRLLTVSRWILILESVFSRFFIESDCDGSVNKVTYLKFVLSHNSIVDVPLNAFALNSLLNTDKASVKY